MLPLGDYPNPPNAQWVTRLLLISNIAIHLLVAVPLGNKPVTAEDLRDPDTLRLVRDEMWPAQKAWVSQQFARQGIPEAQHFELWLTTLDHYALFTQRYSYVPGRPTLLGLLLCMFLHGGWMHVAGNMLYLWIFGDNVEARLGKLGYLVGYLGTGIVATLTHSYMNAGSMIPVVGASGAISGVLGLYLIWFPHNQVRVLFFLFFFVQFIHIRAIWVLGFYVLFEFLQLGSGGGVAHGAHVGGFVAGMTLAWMYNAVRGAVPAPRPQPYVSRRGTPWHPPRAERPPIHTEDPGRDFIRAVEHTEMAHAAHAFVKLVREGGTRPPEGHVFRLGQWLYDEGYVKDAIAVFRWYIKHFPIGENLDRVHLGLGVLLVRIQKPIRAQEHFHAAIDLARDPATAMTARAELDKL